MSEVDKLSISQLLSRYSIARQTLYNKKTNKKPSVLLVKEVLIQIEQWILKSKGQLVQVEWDDGSSSWCPLCLVELAEE